MAGRRENRTYKNSTALIAGLKAGEIRAAAELFDALQDATEDEELVDEVLTILLALLPVKTRKKMLSDHATNGEELVRLLKRHLH